MILKTNLDLERDKFGREVSIREERGVWIGEAASRMRWGGFQMRLLPASLAIEVHIQQECTPSVFKAEAEYAGYA